MIEQEAITIGNKDCNLEDIPLVVDLDGTLLHSDLLHEGIIILLRKNPFYFFPLLFWLLKGKVYFKNQIFNTVQLPYDLLPWNKKLIVFLKVESLKGRKLIVATASVNTHSQEILKVFPFFDEIYGTDTINLKGRNKLKFLVNKFGESGFDYIGNSSSDLTIFASSRYSYLVSPSKTLEKRTRKVSDLKYIWKHKKSTFREYVKAIRAYQWVKNVLVFIPLITSHSFYSKSSVLEAISAFFAFSFTASAGYAINDLFDLNSDRSHPRKRFRSFASGRLSITSGILLTSLLFSAALVISSQLNLLFSIVLLGYFIVSFSYSLYLKRLVLYDVFILALLYSTRIIGGGEANHIPISFWLITFSTFLFLSLAFVKRFSELLKVNDTDGLKIRGREYNNGDLQLLQVMGIVSGFLSIVVFSLYINSPEVLQLYSNPKILWSISFLLLFWISRVWLKANRGEMTDDPIIFAIKDRSSYIIFLIIGLVMLISI